MNRAMATFAFVFMLVFVTAPVLAGVEEVRVHVEGMACPFCAYNIEKRLKTLEGMPGDAPFNVSLENNLATLTWRPDVRFDPAAIREQIRRGGFTPGKIAVTVKGMSEIKTKGDESILRLLMNATDETFVLRRADCKDQMRSYQALREYTRQHKGDATTKAVRVRGEVSSDGSTWSLTLQRWAPTRFGTAVILSVKNMTCENCSTGVMREISKMNDVIHVEADHATNRVWIWTESKSPDIESFKKKIKELGFDMAHTHTDASRNAR